MTAGDAAAFWFCTVRKLIDGVRKMGKRVVLMIGLILAMLFCTSCNTVKGVGKDITTVGEAAEDAVD